MAHNVVLVSAQQQCESALIIRPPSRSPFPSSTPLESSQSPRLGSLCFIATSHRLSILSMVVYIYVQSTFSIHLSFSFLLLYVNLVSAILLSLSVIVVFGWHI